MMGIPTLIEFENNSMFITLFAKDLLRITGSLQTESNALGIFIREPGVDIPEPEIDLDAEVKALAKTLCNAENEELKASREFYKEIVGRGGISRHKDGDLSEEYEEIPIKYRRVDGLSPDEMASESGLSEFDLMARIIEMERQIACLPAVNGKKVRAFRIKDFLDEAWARIIEERGGQQSDGDVPF